MRRKSWQLISCLSGVLTSVAASGGPLEDFRDLVDNRLAVRTSLGVRSARPISDRQVQVVIGMSVTKIAENPAAWRVISYDDPNYAYEKFVRPAKAAGKREDEAQAVAGSPFQQYQRTIVTLDLPEPMKPGVQYYVMGQGVGGEMVTAAHTSAGFVYREVQAPVQPDDAVDQAVLGLRQVESVGPGLVRLEFGPNFSTEAGSQLENYTVSIGGSQLKVTNIGRRSMLDTYLPTGWPFVAIPMHSVYLQLERPLRDGEVVEIATKETITGSASKASLRYGDKTALTNSIKVNQVGYLADSPVKVAYLGRWMGSFPEKKQAAAENPDAGAAFWTQLDGKAGQPAAQDAPSGSPALSFASPPEFQICSEKDGSVAFTGQSKLVHRSGEMDEGFHKIDHSGENVYVLDFTEFKTPGRYFLSVPQVGRSVAFNIGDDAYKQAFEVQSYGVFAQRCGMALLPPYSEWHRIACHNKGIVLTSQVHGEEHNIRDLPKKIVYQAMPAQADAALEKLNSDASLLAYYPLNGDLKDASGNGHDLNSPGRQTFSVDKKFLPGDNQVLGPTGAAESPGLRVAALTVDTANGAAITGWFKKDENNGFHGTLFGIGGGEWNQPRMLVTAGWGVIGFTAGIKGENKQYQRVNDNSWHNLALVLAPESQQPRIVTLYVDGAQVASAPASGEVAGDLVIGAFKGDGTANAYLDDVRIYGRALESAEIAAIAKPRPAEVPQTIMAYGGHHDAGDYNPRSHLDVAQTLMEAYEIAPRKFYDGQLNIPEKGNGVPDILDEAFWALRLWIDLQEEDGGVHNGTESAGDPNFIETVELDRVGDYAYAKDSAGSYSFAGAMAQASRLWRANGKAAEAGRFPRACTTGLRMGECQCSCDEVGQAVRVRVPRPQGLRFGTAPRHDR